MSEYGESFLLASFREFYAEIVSLKPLLNAGARVSPSSDAGSMSRPDGEWDQSGTWIFYPDVVLEKDSEDFAGIISGTSKSEQTSTTALVRVDPKGTSPVSAMEAPAVLQPSDSFRVSTIVWHKLVKLFQRQAIAAWDYGGSYAVDCYKEAQYVMVALADEIFVHTVWDGQRSWMSNLLEARIFRSHAAGQFFFEKLDRLLREQNPIDKDLAAVYLMALSLGFKGKYFGMDDHGRLARYRQQLFTFICGREPDLYDETRFLFPDAYYHNVREESQRKLSDPRKWIVVLCLVIIAYTAATQLFWIEFTREINTVNESITKIIGELKSQP